MTLSYKPLIKSFWKAILCGILIIVISSLSASNVSRISFLYFKHADKVAHFLMYFGFTLFLAGGFKRYLSVDQLSIHNKVIIIIISVSFGIAMELIQLWFVKSRSGEILDFVSNLSGSIIAAFIYLYLSKISSIKSVFE